MFVQNGREEGAFERLYGSFDQGRIGCERTTKKFFSNSVHHLVRCEADCMREIS